MISTHGTHVPLVFADRHLESSVGSIETVLNISEHSGELVVGFEYKCLWQ